jgi:hypothetical protein
MFRSLPSLRAGPRRRLFVRLGYCGCAGRLAEPPSVDGRRRELGELFADDPHLLPIDLVRREPTYLVANGGPDTPSGRVLLQRCPHGLGVRQSDHAFVLVAKPIARASGS